MEEVQTDQAELRALQDSIYRDKVERARQMSPEEKLDAVFSLTSSAIERMKEGIRWQFDLEDDQKISGVLASRIDRLRSVRDREFNRADGV